MYKKPSKTISCFKIYAIILIILASFIAGLFVGRSRTVTTNTLKQLGQVENKYTDQTENKTNFQLFWDVWDIVNEKFIHKPLDYQKMIYGAISGMLESLDDPYTAFLNPEESKEFLAEIEGEFEGIGAEIGIKNELITVISPLSNAPAEQAGLKPNDIIIKINNEDATKMTLIEAVSKIRGKKGTHVKLTIIRDKKENPQEISITRDKIEVKSVQYSFKQNNIAYIKLSYFGEKTAQEFQNAVTNILTKNPKGIILDLRNNAGGYLNSSIDVIDFFIDKNKIAAIEKFSSDKTKKFITKSDPALGNISVVVLVNNGSASASEIVAGALRDIRKIKLIGEKTYGKGSVQELEYLSDGSTVRISIAEWLTPNNTNINGTGLEPDIKIDLTEEDYDQNKDPQLDKAIEELIK